MSGHAIEGAGRGVSVDDLRARLIQALAFAEAVVANAAQGEGLWVEEVDAYLTRAEKAFIEAALLGMIAIRFHDPLGEVDAQCRTLAEALDPRIRNQRAMDLMRRYPHTAAAIGVGHVSLERLGLSSPEFDVAVRAAYQSGHIEAVERLPYRLMDVRWLQGLLLGTRPYFDDIASTSIVTKDRHALEMSPGDLYALTHSIFYVTDFGRIKPPQWLDPRAIAPRIDAAIAACVLSENLDILGELLLCASILGTHESPYSRLGVALVEAAWQELGFLPSPTFEAKRFLELEGPPRSAYAYLHVYHTTFVGGMMAACLLTRPHEEREEPQGRSPRPGRALEGILEQIGTFPGPCRRPDALWLKALPMAGLDSEDLVLVMTDALLCHSCRDYKLGPLAAVIKWSCQEGVGTPATQDAAVAFLKRQQHLSGSPRPLPYPGTGSTRFSL